MYIGKKKKNLDPHLTPYTKLFEKVYWNMKNKLQILEEEIFCELKIGKNFLEKTQKPLFFKWSN